MPRQVLIVGAGPVGMTAAIELIRRGFEVRIIDKASGPAGESRALGVHARTLEILEPAGVTPRMLDQGLRVQRGVICDDRGPFTQLDFSLVRQKYNFVLMLPQSETEKILQATLIALGQPVEWNTELHGFSQHGERVECQIAGEANSCEFDWLVGSDGAHSSVRDRLAIPFDGERYHQTWELADVKFRGTRPTDELHIRLGGGVAIIYFPFAPNFGRFVFTGSNITEAIQREVEPVEVVWRSQFGIGHRIVKSYQQGNVFLAGDAAHIHSPVGGRGMNLGIEDAATLAWLLERGKPEEYTQRRRPLGLKVLKFTESQTKQLTSRNPLIGFLTRRIAPLALRSKAVQRLAFRRLSGADTPRPPWL